MTEPLIEKPEAKPVTLPHVLNYTEAARYVNQVLGYNQRHAHEKFPEQGEYLDYWHYAIDQLFPDGFTNDSYVRYGPHSFQRHYDAVLEKCGPNDWRTAVALVWAQEYPDPANADGYTIWMSW